MKITFIAAVGIIPFISLSCQKDIASAVNNNSTVVVSNVTAPVTVVTFNQLIPLQIIVPRQRGIIFSDSIYVSDDEAILKGLRFEVKGVNLSFTDYIILINGIKVGASGNFEAGILTITPNKPVSLLINNYYQLE